MSATVKDQYLKCSCTESVFPQSQPLKIDGENFFSYRLSLDFRMESNEILFYLEYLRAIYEKL